MQLKNLKFGQYEKEVSEWKLQKFSLHKANLFVGRNASGKSRILNIINGLAELLSGRNGPRRGSVKYEVELDNKGTTYKYNLNYKNHKISFEKLEIDGDVKLKRGRGGFGEIFSSDVGEMTKFQTPDSQLASVARRDTIQHAFLEPLYQWGDSLFLYYFGTAMGKRSLAIEMEGQPKTDLRNMEMIIGIFQQGLKTYKNKFKNSIIKDMCSVGYPITDVGVFEPTTILISPAPPGGVRALYVQEKDLKGKTDQVEMSQGMFRTLALLIHLNFGSFSQKHSTVLIDDIGEGIDFQRSSDLVKLLNKKSETKNFQLLMTTNDRFIMNSVPLDYWCLIKRNGGITNVYNTLNNKKKFDEFRYTGLNNFDFFATDFIE